MTIQSHKDLDVWQLAKSLAVDCYRLTTPFPKEEIYGLTAQIRRASISVPANIAEGYGRDQTGSFIQFLRIAQGSVRELETHIEIAVEVGLAVGDAVQPVLSKCERVSKMVRSLIRSLEARKSSRE
jgi:four helix bundle protein